MNMNITSQDFMKLLLFDFECYQFGKKRYLILLDKVRVCVNLPEKMLLKIDTVWTFIKIVSILDEE